MASRSLRRLLPAAALVAVAALTLAACASESSSAESEASGSSSADVVLRVAQLSTANYLTTSENDGVLEDALSGIGATADFLGPFIPADAYAALNADQADATSTGTAYFNTINSTGSDFVAFAIERYTGNSQGIVAAPGTGIETLEDLYGKTVNVGSAGGTGDYILHRAFEDAGLDISKVNTVDIGSNESTAAFTSGQVDAWSTYDQYFASAQAVDGSTVIASGDQIDSLNWSIHFVNRAFADAHPEAVTAAYDALVEEAAAAQDDPTIITDAYEAFGASADQLDVIAGFAVPTIEPLNEEYVGHLQDLEEQLVRYGFIDDSVDLGDYVFDATAEQ